MNMLHHSILVKQHIQNFEALMKIIQGLVSILVSISICRAGLSQFCSKMEIDTVAVTETIAPFESQIPLLMTKN